MFHAEQTRRVRENDAHGVCFALTLQPPPRSKSRSGVGCQKSMVPTSFGGMKKKVWLKSLRVMSHDKVFAIRDRRPDVRLGGRT